MPVITRRWAVAPKGSASLGPLLQFANFSFWLKNKASGTVNVLALDGLGISVSPVPASIAVVGTPSYENCPSSRPISFESLHGKAFSLAQAAASSLPTLPSASRVRFKIYDGIYTSGKTLIDTSLTSIKIIPKPEPGDFSTADLGAAYFSGKVRIIDLEQRPLDPPDYKDKTPDRSDWSGYQFIPSVLPPEVKPKRHTLKSDLLFSFDSARIRSDAAPALFKLLEELTGRANPNVTIEGHADSTGKAVYNDWLSLERAQAVKQWFMQRGAPAAYSYVAVGKGEGSPIASNATKEGRAQNRRVEVIMR